MLQKNLLTILGCSASLALVSPQQLQARELVFTASSEPLEEEFSEFDCGCSPDSTAAKAIAEEGDKAIALFGCDCAGCRFQTRQALEPKNLR
jgi:hypothetical protein